MSDGRVKVTGKPSKYFSLTKLSSCSIFGVEVGLCAGKIFAIALDFLSYTGIKHFIFSYNRSISKSYLG